MISLIGNIVLTIWFCTLLRSQITRRRDALNSFLLCSSYHNYYACVFDELVCYLFTSISSHTTNSYSNSYIVSPTSSFWLHVLQLPNQSQPTNQPTNEPTGHSLNQTAATTDRGLETARWTPRFRITTILTQMTMLPRLSPQKRHH